MRTEENGLVIIIGVTVGILLVLIPLVLACAWFGTKKYDQLQEERYLLMHVFVSVVVFACVWFGTKYDQQVFRQRCHTLECILFGQPECIQFPPKLMNRYYCCSTYSHEATVIFFSSLCMNLNLTLEGLSGQREEEDTNCKHLLSHEGEVARGVDFNDGK